MEIINENKVYYQKIRELVLKTMQVALRVYDKSKNKWYLEQARDFGKFSELFKEKSEL